MVRPRNVVPRLFKIYSFVFDAVKKRRKIHFRSHHAHRIAGTFISGAQSTLIISTIARGGSIADGQAHALLNALRFTVYPGAPSVLVTDRRFTGTKPKPRWDVHLPEVGDRAGSLAGGIRPLIAGPCGSGA